MITTNFASFSVLYFAGLEISDVLKIDDKDYSITFSLYFNVQWSEPRLNLSREFLDTENITSDDDHLVPGKYASWITFAFDYFILPSFLSIHFKTSKYVKNLKKFTSSSVCWIHFIGRIINCILCRCTIVIVYLAYDLWFP